MRRLANYLIGVSRAPVRRIARAYGLRLDPCHVPHGQHPLVFADDDSTVRHSVPQSVYFNTRSGAIRVGHDTLFCEDVKVLTGMHMGLAQSGALGVELHHVPEAGRDIAIGEGCYIGSGAILIGPLTIGDHAMIGAGAVVTHDVPAHGFAAGVPAKLVKLLDPDA